MHFVAYFLFKSGHSERHYLMNSRGRKYATTFSTDRSDAQRFASETDALDAIRRILDRSDRGQANGYFFVEGIEQVSGTGEVERGRQVWRT